MAYPGTNHVGEYIAWSDDFLASSKIQFFFDPVKDKPWRLEFHLSSYILFPQIQLA